MNSFHPEVAKERYITLLREAEQEQLLTSAKTLQWPLHRALAYQIGLAIKSWGQNLVEFGARRGTYTAAKSALSWTVQPQTSIYKVSQSKSANKLSKIGSKQVGRHFASK
jgi:hypothetical protein